MLAQRHPFFHPRSSTNRAQKKKHKKKKHRPCSHPQLPYPCLRYRRSAYPLHQTRQVRHCKSQGRENLRWKHERSWTRARGGNSSCCEDA
jgi:hypothetical protein